MADKAYAKNIKIIATDMDGTLLSSDKTVSPRTLHALKAASDRGILIVPTTGRNYDGLPDFIKDLKYIRYAVTINGAYVLDTMGSRYIYRAEIPLGKAIEIIDYIKTLPVAWDSFIEGTAYMRRDYQDNIEAFVGDPTFVKTLRKIRVPVDNLYEKVLSCNAPLQKIDVFTRDHDILRQVYRDINLKFDDITVTSSMRYNAEINSSRANKGEALKALCSRLGLGMENVMAFGDGGNDMSMLTTAGIGVAMSNAIPKALEAAQIIAPSNDQDGVASIIEELLL